MFKICVLQVHFSYLRTLFMNVCLGPVTSKLITTYSTQVQLFGCGLTLHDMPSVREEKPQSTLRGAPEVNDQEHEAS